MTLERASSLFLSLILSWGPVPFLHPPGVGQREMNVVHRIFVLAAYLGQAGPFVAAQAVALTAGILGVNDRVNVKVVAG